MIKSIWILLGGSLKFCTVSAYINKGITDVHTEKWKPVYVPLLQYAENVSFQNSAIELYLFIFCVRIFGVGAYSGFSCCLHIN
jgi:hypothetical protein